MSDLTLPGSAPAPRAGGAMATADQQRAIAEVHAAITLARANPRDEVDALNRIINACSRPGLAESGTYLYTRGGQDVTGASIRTAETIAQCWGNFQFGFRELSRGIDPDGVTFSEVEAFAWDVQHNTKRPLSFRVRHWRDTKKGGYPLKDERDIYELVANQAQRRVRSCILALIPGDIVESAVKQCDVTMKTKVEVTPELIASLVEKFGGVGVSKAQIEARIQRNIDAITPAQVAGLGKVFNAIRDGIAVVADYFEPDDSAPAQGAEPPPPAETATQARANSAKERAKAAAQAAAKPQGSAAGAPAVTYAQAADAIQKAASVDAVDLAADLVRQVADEGQRGELEHMYHTRRAELSGDVPQ